MQRVDGHRLARQPDTGHGQNGHKSSSKSQLAKENSNRSLNSSNGKYQNGLSHSDRVTGSAEEGALYTVDHLATFTVGESYELVYPKDGIARLRQMEKSSGIWTQRMYLKLEPQSVVIIDYENGDTVEKFPLDLITSPSYFISQDSQDLYNNVLLFTVKEDPRSKGPPISEMHIFHCLKTSAQKIAEDLQTLTSHASNKNGSSSKKAVPPPLNKPPPDTPSNGGSSSGGVNVKQRVGLFNDIIVNPRVMRRIDPEDDDVDSQRSIDNQAAASISSNYERDVAVLNHCFDDIERFIARLQDASVSYKELERRRRARKNGKKKESGDGLLISRARGPSQKQFVDIFQKFKHSFNLLGKLRSHIHDPNAPELVHFLFTPLALVVDASREAHQSHNIAGNAVVPLLTKEAKQLLVNCLTSKETELWHSLGEAWTQANTEWPGYVPVYIPNDGNGFQSDTSADTRTGRSGGEYDGDLADSSYTRVYKSTGSSSSPYLPQYSDKDRQSEISDTPLDKELERKQRKFVQELERKNAKMVQVLYSRASRNDKELSVERGEILQLLNDTRNWWQARNMRSQVGYVPNTIVAAYHHSAHSPDDAYASYPSSASHAYPHARHAQYSD